MFEFESISDEKIIRKIIAYQLLDETEQIFNLALVDILDNETWSDKTVSNNNDLEKVLSTVVKTAPLFFAKYPKGSIFFTGSSESRTRLYQIVISNYFDQVETNYVIFGLKNGKREVFVKNQRYDGFMFKLKQ